MFNDPIGIPFIRLVLLRFALNAAFFVDPYLSIDEGKKYIRDQAKVLVWRKFLKDLMALAKGRQPPGSQIRIPHHLRPTNEIPVDPNEFMRGLVTAKEPDANINYGERIIPDAIKQFLQEIYKRFVLTASIVFLHNRAQVLPKESNEKEQCANEMLNKILIREKLLGNDILSLLSMAKYIFQTYSPELLNSSKWIPELREPCQFPILLKDDVSREEIGFTDMMNLILHLAGNRDINQASRVQMLGIEGGMRFTILSNPLQIAVLMQDVPLISRLIIEYQANVNTILPYRNYAVNASVLYVACSLPGVAVLNALLMHGADVSTVCDTRHHHYIVRQNLLGFVLHHFFNTGNDTYLDMARVLIRSGVNLKYQLNFQSDLERDMPRTVLNDWDSIQQVNFFGYFIALAKRALIMETLSEAELLTHTEEILMLLVGHGLSIYHGEVSTPSRNFYLDQLQTISFSLRRKAELLYNHVARYRNTQNQDEAATRSVHNMN